MGSHLVPLGAAVNQSLLTGHARNDEQRKRLGWKRFSITAFCPLAK